MIFKLIALFSITLLLEILQESTEPEILGPGNSVEYVWDDLNLPHRLVVQITGATFNFVSFILFYFSWQSSESCLGFNFHLNLSYILFYTSGLNSAGPCITTNALWMRNVNYIKFYP